MSTFPVGCTVRHTTQPGWGLGEVIAVDAKNITVRFSVGTKMFNIERVAGLLIMTSETPPPSPAAATKKPHAGKTKCVACGGTLRSGKVYRGGKLWKSCPECSADDGSEHVLLPYPDAFGTTEARSSDETPDGAQSWCTACRSPKSPRTFSGRRCSAFAPPPAKTSP